METPHCRAVSGWDRLLSMTQIANLIPTSTRETFWRTLQTFSVTRIIIGAVLLVYLIFNPYKGSDVDEQFIRWETCAIYLGIAVGFAVLSMRLQKRFLLQLLIQVAVDITAISMLYITTGGARSGLAILYLFPLAGGAILAPLVLALFFVSAVTLILLTEGGYQLLHTATEGSLSRAGLICAAFFAAVFVMNRLAARLIKQEDLAAQRGRDLRIQEAINRLVIADMDDGILVVGTDGSVFAANPAVERMLGLSVPNGQPSFKLTDLPSLAPVADAFFNWAARVDYEASTESGSTTFVVVKPGDDIAALQGTTTISRELRRELAAHLKLRFKTVETAALSEDRAVIFLQDVTKIENQAQQLKLASMGRLTASIAHEVRNPLSAISHAASLLAEDITNPVQSRLLSIVGDNVTRLNRMIEDILRLSRKAQSVKEPLALAPFFTELLDEFRESHALTPGMIEAKDMGSYRVRFDPLHLREVVVNLLSNALRYASDRRGSIRMTLLLDTGGRLELHVQDDGPPIKPEVRAHLFEPFYTTSSKGTGLGLYVARELCLNNGAMLDYEYRLDASHPGSDEPSGRFVITFAGPEWA
jgi:two-component system sensor histidine kinase PilS (NtrC family)